MNLVRDKLPGKLYKIKVPVMATYTSEEIEIYGLPAVVIDENISPDLDTLTTVMRDIDSMINMYMDGYAIRIVNKEDVTEIFKILDAYVAGRNGHNNYSLNRVEVRDARIDEIDRFVNEMFGNNKPTIVKGTMSTNKGFGLGINVAGVKPIYDISGNNTTFISQQNTPELDLSKIIRTSPLIKRVPVRYEE